MNLKTKAGPQGTAKKNKKQSHVGKFILTVFKMLIIFLVAISCALTGIVGGAVYGYMKNAEPLSYDQLKPRNETSYIYDSNNNEIAKLTGSENKDREQVMDKDIPQFLKDAFVSIEDERFYKHHGVDFIRTGSAILSFVLTAGNPTHGGSTITQQVVKLTSGKTDRSLQRKIEEWYTAMDLEKRIEKWEILEIYMNNAPMANNYIGVGSAAKAYFGKSVSELSLAECALLAGITNLPAKYNPFTEKGRANALERQKVILNKMLELEKIDQRQYEQALKEELVFAKKEDSKPTAVQTYFVDQVIKDVKKDLMEQYNMSENVALAQIYNYGLRIYTTQDSDIQKAMDEVFNDDKYFKIDETQAKKNPEHAQAAMVLIDPITGQIKAMYGGYGPKTASNTLNRATQMERQPGSSFKPIAVYGPAIDQQAVTAATIIDDVPVYMMTTGKDKDKPYPMNYDLGYDGLTSIRNAIKASINVVAATVWRDYLGADKSIEYLKKVGIDRPKEKYVSIAMGGLEKGVSPLQMAAAYQPFVNKGLYYEPITYTKVVDSSGKTILEKKPKHNIVYSEEAAFIMAEMMTEVVKPRNTAYPHNGTASTYGVIKNSKGQIITTAGKTGTTSDNKDKWFVGYSPYYVGATWYGYDNLKKPIRVSKTEYSNAQMIWQAVMNKAHANLESLDFTVPSGVVKKRICIYSGKIATELCSNDPRGNATIEEYFIKGTEPRDDDLCDVHVLEKVCKDSKDAWGRNLIAGPNCPLESVIEKVFIQRRQPYVPQKPDDKYPKDWDYELPAGEYCTVHGHSSPNPDNTVDNRNNSNITPDPIRDIFDSLPGNEN